MTFRVMAHFMLFASKAGCNSARTVPDTPRASPRSWKTIASFSRSVPAVGAMCRSSAPRGWFGRSPCLLPGADLPERPSGSSPKNRCRISPQRDNSPEYAPKASDKSPRLGCLSRKLPPDGCAYTAPARSSVCAAFRRRMTTARLVPVPPPRLWRREPGFAPGEVTQRLFLSQLVTVLRETPKMRLTPRREARSW